MTTSVYWFVSLNITVMNRLLNLLTRLGLDLMAQGGPGWFRARVLVPQCRTT